jgi:hypothetical protein
MRPFVAIDNIPSVHPPNLEDHPLLELHNLRMCPVMVKRVLLKFIVTAL